MKKKRASLEEAEIAAQRLARVLREKLPDGWKFLLFLCSLGEGGYTTYVSDVHRDSALMLVEEWLVLMRGGRSFTDTDVRSECWCCGTRTNLRIIGPEGCRRMVVCDSCLLQQVDR